jgi:hypothetical protein
VIAAVAFCPHPPALVPELGRGADAELGDLRAACRTAIARIVAPGRRLVVLGSGPRWQAHRATARGTLAGYGVPLEVSLGSDEPGAVELPLSLTVGAWLLRDALGPNCGATGYSVVTDIENPIDHEWTSIAHGQHELAVLVMGDGSACRSTSAPGYLDERAAPYDAQITYALRTGQPDLIHDVGAGSEVLAAGEPAWDAIAWVTEGAPWDAALLYDAAPFGVGYFVAVWTQPA